MDVGAVNLKAELVAFVGRFNYNDIMHRFFVILAGFSVGFMLLAIGTGLVTMRDDIRSPDNRAPLSIHRYSGISAGMAVLLVNSVVITYFIGTSRWCREVCEAYSLPASFVERSTVLKRRTFPASVLGIVVIIVVAALGAAADPMAGSTPPWFGIARAEYHLIAVCLGTCVVAWTLVAQHAGLKGNHELIDDIVAEVRRIRTERGLA
jgi:hypothetical protein